MKEKWTTGNRLSLLENGDEFFPQALRAIANARREILVETFILRDDVIGRQFQQALIDAARRGVATTLTVDGFGSYYLSKAFIKALTDAGVVFQMYDPPPKWMRFRTNVFRRLHRKIIVVDNAVAFVGGINLSHNHSADFGPLGKQDYAVSVEGPAVSTIRELTVEELKKRSGPDFEWEVDVGGGKQPADVKGQSEVQLVTRDNDRHHTDIEDHYLQQIRQAQDRITIANAYFFPGYRLLRALRNAARRGVKVKLIIQGQPGSTLAQRAVPTLYDFLVESNIRVYEYWERPLHAKIAAIDDEWSAIGSSNLDPMSLSLNLEANIVVRDPSFNALLHGKMDALTHHSNVRQINKYWIHRRTLWKWCRTFVIFHFLRHFPRLAGAIPSHSPRIDSVGIINDETVHAEKAQEHGCKN